MVKRSLSPLTELTMLLAQIGPNCPKFHVHDFGHNLKNAEASLERGTHFKGQTMYDATDSSLVLSTCDNLKYQEISKGLSHRVVIQYDKHSDELSLQHVLDPVINVSKLQPETSKFV